jgi:hypothetical protein
MATSKLLADMLAGENVIASSWGVGWKAWLDDWDKFDRLFDDVAGCEKRNDIVYAIAVTERDDCYELHLTLMQRKGEEKP